MPIRPSYGLISNMLNAPPNDWALLSDFSSREYRTEIRLKTAVFLCCLAPLPAPCEPFFAGCVCAFDPHIHIVCL